MSKISLTIANSLSVPIKINILGGVADESSQNNADTLYEWDLSAETWNNVDTVTIQTRLSGQTSYQNLSTFVSTLTPEGVANALSSLNVGNFLTLGDVVYTYNSDIEFGQLTLTLSDIPDTEVLLMQAYDYFVPIGSTLRQEVYPSYTLFRNDWLSSFELLLQQTNASIVIQTYGFGATMPLFNNAPSASGAITMTAPSPKAGALQPIMSSDQGVSQGYTQNFTTSYTSAWMLFPSGDANEITQMSWSQMPSYVFYHGGTFFQSLASITHGNHEVRLSTSGMLDSLAALTTYVAYPYATLNYPSGWFFPNIAAPAIASITIDGPGVVPTQTLSNASDFTLSGNTPLNYFLLESLDNILLNPTLGLSSAAVKTFYAQFCNNAVLGANVNTLFSNNLPNASNVFNVGFSNSNVSWSDLSTPLELNGFQSIILNQIDLASFPPIQTMNYYENSTTAFLLNINLSGNNLSVATINQILIDLDATSGSKTSFSGTINLSGQTPAAPPSGAGITAKNNLIANGMTVITD